MFEGAIGFSRKEFQPLSEPGWPAPVRFGAMLARAVASSHWPFATGSSAPPWPRPMHWGLVRRAALDASVRSLPLQPFRLPFLGSAPLASRSCLLAAARLPSTSWLRPYFRTIAPIPAIPETFLAATGLIVRVRGKTGPYSTEIPLPIRPNPYYKPHSCQLCLGAGRNRPYSTENAQNAADRDGGDGVMLPQSFVVTARIESANWPIRCIQTGQIKGLFNNEIAHMQFRCIDSYAKVRCLHTMITKRLVEDFTASCGPSTRKQLLFTTHDLLLLMEQSLMRRDEMYIAQRGTDGCSELVGLAEFEGIRYDKDLIRSYLDGRFGGIPMLGPTSFSKDEVRTAVENASAKRAGCKSAFPDPGMTDVHMLAGKLIGHRSVWSHQELLYNRFAVCFSIELVQRFRVTTKALSCGEQVERNG